MAPSTAVTRGRWDALFADLSGEWEGEQARDLDAEVRDRTAAERARLTLADRLVAHRGATVTVRTGAGAVRGSIADAAADWLLVGDTLVPLTAVQSVTGLGAAATEPDARPRARLSLGYALRRLDGDVVCALVDGRTVRGTIERVGRDHLDVAGETVAFTALASVRPA